MDPEALKDSRREWSKDQIARLHPISADEVPQIRKSIQETTERIFNNQSELRAIIERHEETVQKRWTKKSKLKRRGVLLGAWPRMASEHRPDVELVRRRKPGQIFTGIEKDAFLMPWINQQDLCKTEPLLLMLNSRARNPPHIFAHLDLHPSLFGIYRGAIGMTRYLDGYTMDFTCNTSPECYGQLVESTEPLKVFGTGVDFRLEGGICQPGDGLLLLEIQDRVYHFLVKVCKSILHDIPSQTLVGSQYPVLPEPPLPSANSREDGVVSLAVTHLEASYLAPGKTDFSRLEKLIDARASESEDMLWALREDPQSFTTAMSEFIAHRSEFLPDQNGEVHPVTKRAGFHAFLNSMPADLRLSGISSYRDLMASACLTTTCVETDFWDELRQKVRRVVELKILHFDGKNISPGDDLPPEFAMAIYLLFSALSGSISQRIKIVEITALPSGPLRAYFVRANAEATDQFIRVGLPPPHVQQFITLLRNIILADGNKFVGHLPGVQSLMDEYEKMCQNPENLEAVSPLVADEISNLSLLSECMRQLHLFQPWSSSFGKEMNEPHVLRALRVDWDSHNKSVLPCHAYFMSAPLCQAAWQITGMPYPVNKKRSEVNVAAMRAAEDALDAFWTDNLARMARSGALPLSCERVLLGRQPSRTPKWVESVTRNSSISNTSTDHCMEDLSQLFQESHVNEEKQIILTRPEKKKQKTRGTARLNLPTEMLVPQGVGTSSSDTPATKRVDKRSLKVFNTLFFVPSASTQPGEVPWTEFLHAMHKCGFTIEKLQGSMWQFTPRPEAEMGGNQRSILFHEPHPHCKIPYRDARRFGRRLLRAYGWTGEMFVLE